MVPSTSHSRVFICCRHRKGRKIRTYVYTVIRLKGSSVRHKAYKKMRSIFVVDRFLVFVQKGQLVAFIRLIRFRPYNIDRKD